MNNKPKPAAMLLVVFGLLTALAVIVGVSKASAASDTPAPNSIPSRPLGPYTGIPAVTPHQTFGATTSGTPAVKVSIRVRQQDVEAYALAHVGNLIRLQVSGTPSIKTVQLVTISQTDAILSESLSNNLPGNTPVYLVVLNASGVTFGANSNAILFKEVYELFDANTGNLLEYGAGNHI